MDGSVESIYEHAESLIAHSCQVKRKMVVEDELDQGIRLYLNFGHTLGHAIEATAGYGQVMHGEAVAIGMVQVTKVAEAKGLVQAGLTQAIRQMCQKFGLPVEFHGWNKARGNQLKLVLVPEIGTCQIHPVPLEEMRDFLN